MYVCSERRHTFKFRLGGVFKVADVLRDHFPVDNQVALLVNHVGDHEHLHDVRVKSIEAATSAAAIGNR